MREPYYGDEYLEPGDFYPHEPEFQIIVDGIPWEDADGRDTFTEFEVGSLFESLERQGYSDIRLEES